MTALEVRAEIIKLGRVLDRNPEQLHFLVEVPAADIRRLRESVHEHLFNGDRATFRKLAAAAKLLPTRITAVIAQKAFAPVFVARIAGEMPVDRAIDIAQRMDTGFLADVTPELDPRSVGPIIRQMPVQVVRDVALELIRRREYITMGLFVGYLTDAALEQVIAAIRDEEDLLQIGLFVEAREAIPKLVGMLSDQRLERLVALALDAAKDLWGPALSLMAHVDPAMQRRLGDLVAREDDATLTRLLRRTVAEDLWPAVLPVVARMSPDAQARLLRLDALADPEVLRSIVAAVEDGDLLREVLPLVAATVAAGGVDVDGPQRLLRVAAEADLVPRVLALAALLGTEERPWLARIAAAAPAELQDDFAREVERADLWPQLFDVAATIPADDRAALAGVVRRIAAQRPDLVAALADQAEARGLGDLVAEARSAAGS